MIKKINKSQIKQLKRSQKKINELNEIIEEEYQNCLSVLGLDDKMDKDQKKCDFIFDYLYNKGNLEGCLNLGGFSFKKEDI